MPLPSPAICPCHDSGLSETNKRGRGITIMGIQDIAAKLKSRVETAGFERSVKFDTGSDGVIVVNGSTISTTDGPADCTIKLSLSDFEDLISGDLSPTSA